MTIKKTGRKRYRVYTRLFGAPLMVLQTEWLESFTGLSKPDRLFWLDATLEDITEGRNSEV